MRNLQFKINFNIARLDKRVALFGLLLCVIVTSPQAQDEVSTMALDNSPVFLEDPIVKPASSTTPLTITTAVTDDVGVSTVSLYYRFGRIAPFLEIGGNREFKRRLLKVNSEGDYLVEVPKRRIRGNILEYYIEVTDVEGNTTSLGGPDQPKVVTFLASQVAGNAARISDEQIPDTVQLIAADQQQPGEEIVKAPDEEEQDKPVVGWQQNRWLWAVAGAVVLGVALGGGDSGSNASTGSVTITGPSP